MRDNDLIVVKDKFHDILLEVFFFKIKITDSKL